MALFPEMGFSQAITVDEVKKLPKASQSQHRDNESWWRQRFQAKKSLLTEMSQIDLVLLGDSITHSFEREDAGKSVWDEYYADRNTLNLGFSGDRTEHVIWRLRHGAVEGIAPNLVVVMIGTNNTGHRMDKAADTAAGIERIVKELRKRLPEAKVLLLGIFPRAEKARAKMRRRNDEINEIVSQFADNEAVFYMNINDAFLDDQGKLSREIMPDLLHPNTRGYQIWAEAMEPKIKELMGEK